MMQARKGSSVGAMALRWLGGFALFALCGVAAAQNLVLNPQLTGSGASWTQDLASTPAGTGSSGYVASPDVDGNAASGSLQVNVTTAGPAATAKAEVAARQCVAIPVGQQPVSEARYTARLRVPSGLDAALNASIQVRFFSDAACATAIDDAGASQGRAIDTGTADAVFWYAVGDPQFVPAGAPIAAQSLEVRVAVTKLADTATPLTVQFDNIAVSLNGTTPVTLQQFEVE